ncbi:hypothetical protein [Rubellicoccus peritrichatus]|uniref:Uncharacterized protein n=1 Tax=Rubellicoccus peritrichatus TaxID=3080537 RepID=A0AAQ3LCG6_9BACT|nr:hypothetical protein [Puniceicoccus sp. CR14]WOO43145.1 hypothetical protein RZN69_08570 [Puniceicoccus sp. CR14]
MKSDICFFPEPFWSKTNGWSVCDVDIQSWAKDYPGIDVEIQLRQMHNWLITNPRKANKKDWRKFICHWLGKAYSKAQIPEDYKTTRTFNKPKPEESHTDKEPKGWKEALKFVVGDQLARFKDMPWTHLPISVRTEIRQLLKKMENAQSV